MAVAPIAVASAAPAAPTPYPVRYDVPPVDRHSRLKVAFRLVLALPHLIALYVCLYLAELITFVAWLIGIFAGTYEPGLAALPIGCVRWYARLLTYMALLRDEYPPFGGRPYPMQFDLPLQQRQSRASIFFRGVLVLPHVVVGYVLGIVWAASVALAWFTLLITGRYPEGLRRLVIGLNRWLLRVLAYTLLLRGDYPPFSLGLDESAPVDVPFDAAMPLSLDEAVRGVGASAPLGSIEAAPSVPAAESASKSSASTSAALPSSAPVSPPAASFFRPARPTPPSNTTEATEHPAEPAWLDATLHVPPATAAPSGEAERPPVDAGEPASSANAGDRGSAAESAADVQRPTPGTGFFRPRRAAADAPPPPEEPMP